MKKFYTLLVAIIFGLHGFAQSDVTFMVDMNNETVNANGVHLAGSFGADGYDEWDPGSISMTDDDSDGVYEVTLTLSGDNYEFKFINGDDWPFEEDVPNICQVELDGNSNRSIDVEGDMTYMVCFGQCAACNEYSVLFRVDMSLHVENVEPIDPSGVHVAGDFQGAVWDPGTDMMEDEDGDLVFEKLISFDPSILSDGETLKWKYINGNQWFLFNEFVPEECGDPSGNREIVLEGTNTLTEAYCFNTCGTCVAPTQVTFNVDMSNETVSANGVHIAGAFQGWIPGSTEMIDDDEDGIYSVTLAIPPDTYEYKVVNGNDWDADDQGNLGNESPPAACSTNNNREIEVMEGDPMTVQFCYNQCEEVCVANPDPAEITFRVDMSETPVSADGLFMIGDFTLPQWQEGATQMTDDDMDNVYECTVMASGSAEIEYKYVNGDLDVTANEEFNIADCGLPNGLEGFNRVHVRSGEPEVLDLVCYDSCEPCQGTGVESIKGVKTVSIFPNPSNGLFNMNLSTTTVLSADLTIFNSMGQIILTENLRDIDGEILYTKDLSSFAQGLYTVQLSTIDEQLSRQFIVK